MLDEQYAIVLVGLNKKQMRTLPERIKGIGRVDSIGELIKIYSAVDVFVNPSVEETFGMTTVEAMACGTSAIVYQGTACEEIIHYAKGNVGAKGIAIPADVQSLYSCITGLLGRGHKI